MVNVFRVSSFGVFCSYMFFSLSLAFAGTSQPATNPTSHPTKIEKKTFIVVPISKPATKPASLPASKASTQKASLYPNVFFGYDASDIVPACEQMLAEARKAASLIVKGHPDPTKATFQSAILPFENLLAELDQKIGVLYVLKSASPNKAVRKACRKCLRPYFGFWSKVFARSDLYKIFQHVRKKQKGLDPVERRLLSETLKAFQRNGAALADAKRKEVATLNTKLSSLSMKFGSNRSQDKTIVLLSKEELKGVPKSLIAQFKKNKAGQYMLPVRIASWYLTFLRNAKSPEARKKVLLAYENIQAEKNTKLLEQVLSLRSKVAKLLGFATHADFVVSDRMAKKSATVLAFMQGLQPKLRIKMEQELKELLKWKQKEFPKATKVTAWDWRYYANQQKKQEYAVDDEKIRQYFPMDHVITSVFDIYQRLLSVRFQEIKPAKAWHPEVRLFAIFDNKTKKIISHFYLDLFPRPGKYTHFAAFGFQSGRLLPSGKYSRPVSAIIGNWPKPAAGKPSLINHDGVETFFHEFGHIMHQTLTTARYASMSGTSVKRDFVEAPSQMLENWIWKPMILKKISKHWKTGKPLPNALIQKMLRAKHLNEGLSWSRQLFYATVDMTFHSQGAVVDTAKVWREVVKKVMPVAATEGTRPAGNFGHLMGYSAGYYGYLWSKVYAQDMFTVFEKKGLLSPEAGGLYRKWILEKGGSMEPMELLKGFLGRKPSSDAFYRELGLKSKSSTQKTNK